jgi:hypothetical protein
MTMSEPRGTQLGGGGGGGYVGRGLPKQGPDGGGLGRMKMTSDGVDGWSPAVEIELRRGSGPVRSSWSH